MKLGFISDLHIDRNFKIEPEEYFEAVIQLIFDKRLDIFIIGGDISNHYTMTLEFVEQLQSRTQIPVYFIPGNHDFWEEKDTEKQTWNIYDIYKNHKQSLLETPLKLTNEFGLVAHTGWYNHAIYNRKRFNSDEIEKGKYRMATWQDKERLDWQKSDPEISLQFANQAQKDIELIQSNQLILVTHMITIPEFTIPMPNKVFDFFNAFIATDDFKDIHNNYPISYSFMGHVHLRAKVHRNQTNYITNSLGYGKEWRNKRPLHSQLKDALYVLEI